MTLRDFLRAFMFIALLGCAGAAESAVRAWVDGNAADGNIELHLERDGQTSGEPDLAPLKQDFDVLGSNRSSSIQIINGSASSSTRIELSLSPKRAGALTIPALTWGNEKSDPIVVNGSASNAATPGATGGAAKVFLKTAIQPQRSYVQAGVDLTVRLYAAVSISQADLELPANNDVLVQQVGPDRNETAVENGVRYQVLERHYELFPQRSGSLTLPGPVLSARIAVQDRDDLFGDFKDFFGNFPMNPLASTKPIRVRADDIALTVLPRPASAAGDSYWLPARHVSLEAEWHPEHGRPQAGDPVTLDLHLTAQGLTAAQLPDLSALLKLPEGIKAYPDQPSLKNAADGASVTGERDQSIALIADRAGEFTVPAVSVHWWDTNANVEREATMPARTLTFAPGAQSATTSQPAAAAPPPLTASRDETRRDSAVTQAGPGVPVPAQQPWFWLSLILGVLWLMTLIAWYVSRRGRGQSPPARQDEEPRASAAEARRRFQEACRRNDARAARANLREWLQAALPAQHPINLHAFANDAANDKLASLLRELDRACFFGSPWVGANLAEALKELPAEHAKPHAQREQLLPLYK